MKLPHRARGERFDRAICQALTHNGVSCSIREVRKALREGAIRVNQQRVAAGCRVVGGEEIYLAQFQPRGAAQVKGEADLCPNAPVLADWLDILALGKPAGWACAPLRPDETGTLLGAAVAYDSAVADAGPSLEGGLAHRLDIGTSGVVLFGRNTRAREQLRRWFSEHTISKTYIAVVEIPASPLPAFSDKAIRPGTRRVRVGDGPGALKARSDFELVAQSADAWVVCIRTFYGRRHQVRAHLAELGAAIHGDIQYGGRDGSRLMLHAARIDLPDGRSVEAPIPASFTAGMDSSCFRRAGLERVRGGDTKPWTP